MITSEADTPGQPAGGTSYACPACGGGIGRSCRCDGRAADWLYAEAVIVGPAPSPSRRVLA